MQNYQSEVISPKKIQILIDKLLRENFSLSQTAKIAGVSEQWLQSYVRSKDDSVS
ncbi:hypothetical protein [Kamptonema formosum]|uniref:hypothetical protein n=1 Tax=Kamptonema formosum TaxID=331992 RepID=UPI000349E63F|nr:hypothetical protein [Oscillatoria sp. PCC 10802]